MNRLRSLLTLSVFSLLILGLPSLASAQWGNNRNDNRRDRNDDYYGRNRNGNYGGYGNSDMRSVLSRLKQNTRNFVNNLDRSLDNSRYNGRNREDRINDIAKDFRNAVNRLDSNSGRYGNNNSNNEMRNALNLANRLESAFRNAGLRNYNMLNQWNYIRQDLNTLAGYGYNDPYNRNRNRTNNGNRRNNLPFPLPF